MFIWIISPSFQQTPFFSPSRTDQYHGSYLFYWRVDNVKKSFLSLSDCTLVAYISGLRVRIPGHSRSWSTFVWNFYLQPTFRSRVLVLTWANWLNCPYINNPNTLAGSRPLLTTPVTFPPSSCLPYLERKRQRQRQNNILTCSQGQDPSSPHLSLSLPAPVFRI